MSPWARASDLGRILVCPPSAVLPQGEVIRSEGMRAAADWGTMAHHWKATGEVQGPDNLVCLFKKRQAHWPDRDVLWPPTGTHEVAVGLCCITGRVASIDEPDAARRDAWKAALGSSWISGTMDYRGDLLGRPWVDDLKTGRYCPVPENDPQFLFYGLVEFRLRHDDPEALVLSATHWPRYPIDTGVKRRYGTVSRADLAEFEQTLRSAYRQNAKLRMPIRQDQVVPGDHCTFCPARKDCPQ